MILTTHLDGTIVCQSNGLEVCLAPDGTLASARIQYAHGTIPIIVTPPAEDAPERERTVHAETVAAWQFVAMQAAPTPIPANTRKTA